MATGDITVTVTWDDWTTTTYVIAVADAATLEKGDLIVKFKGKRTSSPAEASPKDREITRALTREITYVVSP